MMILPAQDFEDLVDARDHAQAMAAHRRGEDEGLTDAELDAYLAAPSPLAFWRQRRDRLHFDDCERTAGTGRAHDDSRDRQGPN